MFVRFNNFISTIGVKDISSYSARLKYRTLNWILFWSCVASLGWALFLATISNTNSAYYPLLSAIGIPFLLAYLNKNSHKFNQVLNISIFTAFFVPAMVQIFHGGFVNSGAAIVWTILAPITALILKPIHQAKRIFIIFLAVLFLVAIIEVYLTVPFVEVSKSTIVLEFLINIISVISICYFPILHFSNEMMKARRIIKTQNNQIISSIEYANYIQRASLSSEEELSASLNNDYFLYYAPKDIVGGDFYWVAIKMVA